VNRLSQLGATHLEPTQTDSTQTDLSRLEPLVSRDITQISKKGNFIPRENWEIILHKYSKKGNSSADHLILAGIKDLLIC
jgi:hypothetical protein